MQARYLRLIRIALLALTIGSGCSSTSVKNDTRFDPQTKRVEEKAIYSLLTQSACAADDQARKRFIVDQTDPAKSVLEASHEEQNYWQNQLKDASSIALDDLLNDFRTANRDAYQLSVLLDSQCEFLSQDDYKEILRVLSQEGWNAVHAKYPSMSGYMTFSKIGFNSEMNQALVYRQLYCGFTCGGGSLTFLVKIEGIWKFEEDVILWVS